MGEVPQRCATVPLAQDLAEAADVACGSSPAPRSSGSTWTCARRTTWPAAGCCIDSSRSESPGAGTSKPAARRRRSTNSGSLEWMPEFAVAVIEANIWGNTVEAAATAKIVQCGSRRHRTGGHHVAAGDIDPRGPARGRRSACSRRIQAMAALGADVRHLMDALLPMARVARYGDVRGTEAAHVEPIIEGMFERALVGIAAACSALDDDAALRMVESMADVSGGAPDFESRRPSRRVARLPRSTDAQGRSSAGVRLVLPAACSTRERSRTEELYRLARLALVAGKSAGAVCGLGHGPLARQRHGSAASRRTLAGLRPLAFRS